MLDKTATVQLIGSGGKRDMLCLPLEFLNGWLFGVSASRVNFEIREQLIRYQKECYRVLSTAFVNSPWAVEVSPTTATLLPADRFKEAMDFLSEWHASLAADEPF